MKKIFLIAGLLSSAALSNAQAQSYNPYYPSNVPNNYTAPAYNTNPQRQAQKTPDFKKFSIGADFVSGSLGIVEKDITLTSPLPGGPNFTTSTSNFDDNISSINGNIGWRPFRYFGLEAFYQKSLENNDVQHRESYAGYEKFAQAEYSVKYEAYGLDLVGYWPVASWFEILGTVGVANYDISAELNFNGYKGDTNNKYSSIPYKMDESKTAFRYGAGAQIWLSQRLAFRAMYRYTSIGGEYFDDISEVSLGVRYNF